MLLLSRVDGEEWGAASGRALMLEKKFGLPSDFFPGAFFLPLNSYFLNAFSFCVNSQDITRETHNCF